MIEAVRVCRLGDIEEGEPMPIDIEGFPPLAIYKVGESYFATDNTCTHGNALLSDGFQEDYRIECPFHGGAFDIRTGAAVTFPCQIAIRTYPILVDGEWLTVSRQPAAN